MDLLYKGLRDLPGAPDLSTAMTSVAVVSMTLVGTSFKTDPSVVSSPVSLNESATASEAGTFALEFRGLGGNSKLPG